MAPSWCPSRSDENLRSLICLNQVNKPARPSQYSVPQEFILGSVLQVGQKWTTTMCFGSKVVISRCPQCLHTGVPHPEHDVSVWMPQEQASSFRAGCIEMPLSCLVDVVGLYEKDCYFYAKGEAGEIMGLR
jgi:hypothetical protein